MNFWDLNFSESITEKSKINSTIEFITKKFDLIMISDYMDESLVLMKDKLDLSLEDIVYFSQNKR